MTVDHQTDMTEMFAVHDCPAPRVREAASDRQGRGGGRCRSAAVVGGHVLMMTSMLHAHHEGEDELVWPLLEERSPEHADLVSAMVGQHESMMESVETAQAQARAWMASPDVLERSSLHTTLIKLEKELLHHLAMEEQEVVPLISRDLTQEEYAAVGAHSRAALSHEQLAVGLGLILAEHLRGAGRGDPARHAAGGTGRVRGVRPAGLRRLRGSTEGVCGGCPARSAGVSSSSIRGMCPRACHTRVSRLHRVERVRRSAPAAIPRPCEHLA